MKLIFKKNAMVIAIGQPIPVKLDVLGINNERRVSYIWPASRTKRVCFRALRYIFGERGRVAVWTRSWETMWTVRFAETPHKVEFSDIRRRKCIDWEIEKVEKRYAYK